MTIDLLPLLPALFPIPLWLLAILVGLWNNHRGNSFWVGFLLSLFFTPIGGASPDCSYHNQEQESGRDEKKSSRR